MWCMRVCVCVRLWNANKINLVETSEEKNGFKCATTGIVAREIRFTSEYFKAKRLEWMSEERQCRRENML